MSNRRRRAPALESGAESKGDEKEPVELKEIVAQVGGGELKTQRGSAVPACGTAEAPVMQYIFVSTKKLPKKLYKTTLGMNSETLHELNHSQYRLWMNRPLYEVGGALWIHLDSEEFAAYIFRELGAVESKKQSRQLPPGLNRKVCWVKVWCQDYKFGKLENKCAGETTLNPMKDILKLVERPMPTLDDVFEFLAEQCEHETTKGCCFRLLSKKKQAS